LRSLEKFRRNTDAANPPKSGIRRQTDNAKPTGLFNRRSKVPWRVILHYHWRKQTESNPPRVMCGKAVGCYGGDRGMLSINAAFTKVPGLSMTSISLILAVGLKLPNRSQYCGVTRALPFDCINEKYMFLAPHLGQASHRRH
jgi:hypothetical protein